jgi:hypothetical protein
MIETPKKRGPGRPPLPGTKRRNVLRVHLTDAEMKEVDRVCETLDATATSWARGVVLAACGLGFTRHLTDRARSAPATSSPACSVQTTAKAES